MSKHFNYYYGSQADQFSFIRIPKIMLIDNTFSDLSLQAKVLYGVLLDRMSLSRKNGWLDAENRVFIIYQIGEIQKDLGFSKKKSIDLLAELEKFGLLEKKRRGHGLPNILYVKSFMSDADTEEENLSVPEEKEAVLPKRKTCQFRRRKRLFPEVPKQILQEFRPQDPRVMMLIRQDRLFLLTEVPEMTLLP